MDSIAEEGRLCYVDGPWAFFTTQPLSQQWGDDWNDAPYEHNAGDPYRYSEYDAARGKRPWVITTVAFQSELQSPCDSAYLNSPYSVEMINAKQVPWLRAPHYASEAARHVGVIWAGTTLTEFMSLIEAAGGAVYVKREMVRLALPIAANTM